MRLFFRLDGKLFLAKNYNFSFKKAFSRQPKA
jgi:hypothetical protein